MVVDVSQLVQAAGQSANAGRWQEAEGLWRQVLALEPHHAQALFSLGIHALQRGDVEKGYELLCTARTQAPADLVVLSALGNACRQRGDPEGEREAIDAALTVDAYFLPALLAKASWFERFGTQTAAVTTYANALKISPPESQWPAALLPELKHAREVVDRRSAIFHDYLLQKLAHLQERLPPPLAERWTEAAAIRARRAKPFTADSNQLHVPRLPALPFFDRKQFPSLEILESKTEIIRDELLEALKSHSDQFNPYITYKPGDPVNQWRELNHSPRWSAFHLWRGGSPIQENLERCPVTAEALRQAGMADIEDLCPNALFSALAPRTHIPPHNGETNARLVAHLPLIVPDGCEFRVGFEKRRWEVGKILVFDDTIEHEARNDSDELRVVLIFDLWNPLLEPAERDLVQEMAKASREFQG